MQNIAINFISYFLIMGLYWHICCYSICHFWWCNIHNRYNFITCNYWSISNTLYILAILINACTRIPAIVFFVCTTIFTFTLTCFIIPFLIWIICLLLNLHLQLHEICLVIALDSFLYVIILNMKTSTSFSFLEHTFLEIRH